MTGVLYGSAMADTEDELLTLQGASAVLGVSVGRVRDLIREGLLPGVKNARGEWQVHRAAVEKYGTPRPRRPGPLTAADKLELAELQQRADWAYAEWRARIYERNQALVRLSDQARSPLDLARAVGMGRQNLNTILRETRARLAEEAARARQ